MPQLDLTFDQGAPLDATKLQQLVTYLNEIDAKSLKLPDITGAANQALSQRLVADVYTYGTVTYTGSPISIPISFKAPLVSAPASVTATIETTSSDVDLVYYIKDISNLGFTIVLNRVTGTSTNKTSTVSSSTYSNVKIHYFAIASSVGF